MLGPAAAVLLSLVILAYAFGSCTAFLKILAECAAPLAQRAAAGGAACWATRTALVCFGGCLPVVRGCRRRCSPCLLLVLQGLRCPRPAASQPQACKACRHRWVHRACLIHQTVAAPPPPRHTNVVVVFNELEDEPALLSRPASSAALAAAPCSSAATGDASATGGASAAGAALEAGYLQLPDGAATGLAGDGTADLQRPFRSVKLLGMVNVVAAARESARVQGIVTTYCLCARRCGSRNVHRRPSNWVSILGDGWEGKHVHSGQASCHRSPLPARPPAPPACSGVDGAAVLHLGAVAATWPLLPSTSTPTYSTCTQQTTQ